MVKIINKNKDGDSNQQEADLPYQIYVKYPVICALVKIIKRLILLVFSLLGLFSAYLLIEWEFYTSFPEETFNTLGSVLPFMICTIFVLIAYPSIIYLYRLLKKDFIQVRLKYRK